MKQLSQRLSLLSPLSLICIFLFAGNALSLAASSPTVEAIRSPTPADEIQASQGDKTGNALVFAYDQSVPFDLRDVLVKEQGGVTVRDVSYAAITPQRDRIKAYLIKPKGNGPFAGVLFFHWLGEKNSDRNEFLKEAVTLAKQGTVCLLIQGYFPWQVAPSNGQTDRQRIINETIEVRRALDLLLAQPNVDPKRIGFVGHDYGAMYGSIVSGVDKRVKAYVLLAPIGSFSYWSLAYWLRKIPETEKTVYRQAMTAVEPIDHISRAAPAALLLQFATKDEHIPKAEANAFINAASEPKEVKWYDSKHALDVPAALKDRDAWLGHQLGLSGAK